MRMQFEVAMFGKRLEIEIGGALWIYVNTSRHEFALGHAEQFLHKDGRWRRWIFETKQYAASTYSARTTA